MAGSVLKSALVAVFFLFWATLPSTALDTTEKLKPRILIASLVRNKAHSLPYFLWAIENLDYPKDRISLWFRSDHNIDNSSAQVKTWLDHVTHYYHSVDYEFDDTSIAYQDQTGPLHWSMNRFLHVMQLRQEALDAGKNLWADYVLMIDADVILLNANTLQKLIEQDKTIIAPLLNVTVSVNYANFWGDMDEHGYYSRSDDYFAIKDRDITGCFPVAMVHSALLINLNHKVSNQLVYYPLPSQYRGPFDDIIAFAHTVKYAGVDMYLLNDEFFGFVPLPMESDYSLAVEAEQFVHIRTEAKIEEISLPRIPYLYPPPLVDEKDKLGFDQVYMINLKRRPDRRVKMEQCFEELGIDYQYIEAVDGKLLNVSYLQSLNVRMLPGYKDPYHGRPLTRGEIGCFLSHYMVWQDVLDKGYDKVLVFEDDIRFEPYFRRKLAHMMKEVKKVELSWDLIYIGRRSNGESELRIPQSKYLVLPGYSYWTLAYMLSQRGARKLLAADPLSRLMALDEYISVMYNKNPDYLGRKKLRYQDEAYLEGSEFLVYPHYSYWTLSYLVTRAGIEKMLSHKPLTKLIPIDEFIPILFDKHSEDEWRKQFHPRNLLGFSVEPLLVYPTRYTGEPGYITDTDDSDVLNFDSDGILHEGQWVEPGSEEELGLEETPAPGEKRGSSLRDIDDIPQGKDEL